MLKHREGVTYWSVEGRSILTAWTCRPYRGVLPLSENLDVLCHRQQAIKNQRSRGDLGWLYGYHLTVSFHICKANAVATGVPNCVPAVFRGSHNQFCFHVPPPFEIVPFPDLKNASKLIGMKLLHFP